MVFLFLVPLCCPFFLLLSFPSFALGSYLVPMSRRGVWAVSELLLRYCDKGGSSKGVREFMRDVLPEFKEKELPQGMQITTRRTRYFGHPTLAVKFAEHEDAKNKRRYVVPLRNLDSETVLMHVRRARDTLPYPHSKLRPASRRVGANRSLQGVWTSAWQRAVNLAESRGVERGGFSPKAP